MSVKSLGEGACGAEVKAIRLHMRWHSDAVGTLTVTLHIQAQSIHCLVVES